VRWLILAGLIVAAPLHASETVRDRNGRLIELLPEGSYRILHVEVTGHVEGRRSSAVTVIAPDIAVVR